MGKQVGLFDMLEHAKNRMDAKFKTGAEEEKALVTVIENTVIRDRLVAPKAMHFSTESEVQNGSVGTDGGGAIVLGYAAEPGFLSIHRHALNQLCSKVGFPMTYYNMLSAGAGWRQRLITTNLNTLFSWSDFPEKSGNPRFLHRIVGTELRGFLSRRFNRHLASAPLLRAFTESAALEGARPVEAIASPVRNALKYLLPGVYEAFPGEYIAVGVEWSNSDFGSGRLRVMQTVWRVSTGTAAVIDEGLARAHIGSVIEDADVDMSDETAKKEVAAQQSAVRDYVRQFLSEKAVTRIVEAVQVARTEKLDWTKLRARLRDVLNKSDLDWMQSVLETGDGIIDLPPISFEADGTRVPNGWWAASALGAIASRTEDKEKKMDIQRRAGELLTK